jgi:hypothetical protein
MLPKEDYTSLKSQGFQAVGATITGYVEGEKFILTVAGLPLSEFANLKNHLCKAIRKELMSKGKTFTKLRDYQQIKDEIYRDHKEGAYQKWKAVNTYKVDGQFFDIQTSLNKMNRGEEPAIRDIAKDGL